MDIRIAEARKSEQAAQKSVVRSCPSHKDWRALYRAAILETNKSVILQKIVEAETALLARGGELFYSEGTR
jgi:hypothetical protein